MLSNLCVYARVHTCRHTPPATNHPHTHNLAALLLKDKCAKTYWTHLFIKCIEKNYFEETGTSLDFNFWPSVYIESLKSLM